MGEKVSLLVIENLLSFQVWETGASAHEEGRNGIM
jgi:hypothetical protein